MAIQLALAAGAQVIAMARGREKVEAARVLGADIAIGTCRNDLAQGVRDAGGAVVILEMVCGDYFRQDLEALDVGGGIIFIAAQGGHDIMLPIFAMMQKRAAITGSTLRNRGNDEKARIAREVERVVWSWIAQGKIKPQVRDVFQLADAGAAHERLGQGRHVGKIILVP